MKARHPCEGGREKNCANTLNQLRWKAVGYLKCCSEWRDPLMKSVISPNTALGQANPITNTNVCAFVLFLGAAMLILLLCFYMLVAHWFACIWYSIGRTDSENYLTYSWLWKLGNVTQVNRCEHQSWAHSICEQQQHSTCNL